MLMAACQLSAQTKVSGIVSDGKERLVGANVFIVGTIDGCLTDTLGRFAFDTSKKGQVTLQVTYMGYEDYSCTADVGQLSHLSI